MQPRTVARNGFQVVAPTDKMRADYDAILQRVGQDVIATQSHLRREVALGTTSAVEFDLSKNTATSNTEVALATNDAFVVTHLGIFIGYRKNSDTDNRSLKLATFPNGALFNPGGATAAALAATEAFYNGRVGVRVNDTLVVSDLDALAFQRTDTAQEGQAQSTVATTGLFQGSFWGQDAAFKSMTPNIMFNGPWTNRVNLEFPAALNFSMAAAATPLNLYAVLICRGFKLANGGTLRTNR